MKSAVAIVGFLAVATGVAAQQPVAGSLYQRYAPIDLTGTWVSIVTEDWDVRMIAPPKGNFNNLPLTRSAQDAAKAVDLAQLEANGRACDAYSAPTIMREPGRVRISWQDANTLKIETDAGEQTRLLHFGAVPDTPKGAASRQGFSAAEWQYANGFDPIRAAAAPAGSGRGGGLGAGGPGGPGGPGGAGGPGGGAGGGARGGGGFGRGPATAPSGGKLKVETTNLAPGLLRKNGVPYSANATVTEYYNLLTEPGGTQWFVVTTVVHDPENLVVDFITSTNFRKEPDNSKWHPTACSLR